MLKMEMTTKFLAQKIIKEAKRKVKNPLFSLGHDLIRYGKALVNKPYSKSSPSKEGEPPRKRKGILQKSILFRVENSDLWVGVIKKSKTFYGHMLEFGGRFVVKRKGKSKGKRIGQVRVIAPRPFMKPTLKDNLSKIPNKFKNFMM